MLPVTAVTLDVRRAAHFVRYGPLLVVLGNADVRHSSTSICRPDRHIHDIHGMCWTHDALIELSYIHVELVQIHILLVVHSDEVVEGVTSNGEDRGLITLGIVETVEKVNAAWHGGCAAHSQTPCIFGVSDGSKCSGGGGPGRGEAQLILMGSQSLEKSIYTISR